MNGLIPRAINKGMQSSYQKKLRNFSGTLCDVFEECQADLSEDIECPVLFFRKHE